MEKVKFNIISSFMHYYERMKTRREWQIERIECVIVYAWCT